MSFFDRFMRKSKVGDMNDILRGVTMPVKSGVTVTPDSAMRCSTVYSCIAVLSESIAQLPLLLYKRNPDGSRERINEHPIYSLLHDRPNDWQTAFEFWEFMTTQVALRGNAYAYINRGVGGKVLELIPLQSSCVTVKQASDFSLTYEIPDGKTTRIEGASNILHLRYRSLDGFLGLSPIAYNRETVGLSVAATEHGAGVFGSGAVVSGVLSIPGQLSPEAAKNIRDSWNENYHGGATKKTAVLDNGAKWEPVALTAEDAQYIETRKLQRSEIAAIYRIPPHKIGDLEKATFSNIEHQSIEFVSETLVPWLRRFEQAISRDLLTLDERKTIYPEFLVEGLLRGDSASRSQLYKEMFSTGAISTNEIRARENLNGIGSIGDVRYVPSNFMPLGATGPQSQTGVIKNA